MKNFLKQLSLIPDKSDIKALLISFAVINFTFLYHTLNFMWGNHDVKFIKEELLLSSGLFEGRFTQFIPYRLLVSGQILPILNNLLGFIFLTLALWVLAKYWNIKKSTLNYVIFISFCATEPYTLSWLYFTFITISCLLWTLLAILGLYISSFIVKTQHKLLLSIIAILCFYTTLGGYPPIINLFAVGLCAKLAQSYIFEEKTLKELFNIYKYTVLNILIAAILFKLTLKLLPHDSVYNLETTAIKDLPYKLISTFKIAFNQFIIAVPFMEQGYKYILALMSLLATVITISHTPNILRRIIVMLLIILTIWATATTTLLVVPHTEYVSRIDFYGFGFLYTFFLALFLNYKSPIGQSLAIAFMCILIPFNILNNYQALKIWKLGAEAEFQVLEDISERIENHPLYNPQHKYRFYQAGDLTMRPAYYHGKYDIDDVFLLSLPYLAMWQGANLVEFYAQDSFIDHSMPILPTDITPDVYDYFRHDAAPWPHPNSIYINNDIIIIIYNQYGLDDFRSKLHSLYQ